MYTPEQLAALGDAALAESRRLSEEKKNGHTPPEVVAKIGAESAPVITAVSVTPVEPPEPTTVAPVAEPVLGTFGTIAKPLIERGIPVTPILPGTKKAFLPDFPTTATTDVNQVLAWDAQFPGHNAACVARAEEGGIWLWEVDSADARERVLKETGNDIFKIQTFKVRSRPGRGHFYFRQTAASMAMGNISQTYVVGQDWSARVNREYVVAPGSIHPDTGEPYTVLNDAPIAEAPQWLIDWLLSQKIIQKKDSKDEMPRNERGKVPHGAIHGFLLRRAGMMRAAGLDVDVIEPELIKLAHDECEEPIDESKVIQIARSMGNYQKGTDWHEIVMNQSKEAIEASIPVIEDESDADSRFEMEGDTFDTSVYEKLAERSTPYPVPSDGDLISVLAKKLVHGTSIPLAYVREPLKAAVLHALDGKVEHHAFPKMSLRGNYFSLGESEGGKTTGLEFALEAADIILKASQTHPENLFRYKSETTFIRSFTPEGTLKRDTHGTVKSGRPGHASQFLYIKEGNLVANSTDYFAAVFSQLTNLYDQTEAGTESMTNGDFTAPTVKTSTVMCFTPSDFKDTFGGKGTIGGGGLNRWGLVNPVPIHDYDNKDWERLSDDVLAQAKTALTERVFQLMQGDLQGDCIVLTEEPEAVKIRLEVKAMLKKLGAAGKRLMDYFMREQMAQAAASQDGRLIMTGEQARYAKAWVEAQVQCRLTSWPSDAANQIEQMEHAIRKAVSSHFVSESKLKDACNFYRPGSGGWFVYKTALANSTDSGAIKWTGRTRKKVKAFCPRSCAAHPEIKEEKPGKG